jgi:hypothetical protein
MPVDRHLTDGGVILLLLLLLLLFIIITLFAVDAAY